MSSFSQSSQKRHHSFLQHTIISAREEQLTTCCMHRKLARHILRTESNETVSSVASKMLPGNEAAAQHKAMHESDTLQSRPLFTQLIMVSVAKRITSFVAEDRMHSTKRHGNNSSKQFSLFVGSSAAPPSRIDLYTAADAERALNSNEFAINSFSVSSQILPPDMFLTLFVLSPSCDLSGTKEGIPISTGSVHSTSHSAQRSLVHDFNVAQPLAHLRGTMLSISSTVIWM
mmetsp:Transcript_10276/g.15617  ORF Transcript_10276/g.15617 Transcript_10276/m.15617 type:complete len:230 (+) Transcript_10276:1761-2450(+)